MLLEEEALQKGMEAKAVEFVKQGAGVRKGRRPTILTHCARAQAAR